MLNDAFTVVIRTDVKQEMWDVLEISQWIQLMFLF